MSEYHAAIGLASLQKWELQALARSVLQADLMHEIIQASRHPLAWQAQGPGGPLTAPTLLCVRLPGEVERAALEQACQQARIMTRRWYQPLLSQMGVLAKHCVSLQAPNAQALARTLLGLPFFLGITPQQRQRVMAVLAR